MVGNLYLNRGITGALVGRQPFGGFKMSGIGSKAGGPDYLSQFVIPRTITENTMRRGFAPVAGELEGQEADAKGVGSLFWAERPTISTVLIRKTPTPYSAARCRSISSMACRRRSGSGTRWAALSASARTARACARLLEADSCTATAFSA